MYEFQFKAVPFCPVNRQTWGRFTDKKLFQQVLNICINFLIGNALRLDENLVIKVTQENIVKEQREFDDIVQVTIFKIQSTHNSWACPGNLF